MTIFDLATVRLDRLVGFVGIFDFFLLLGLGGLVAFTLYVERAAKQVTRSWWYYTILSLRRWLWVLYLVVLFFYFVLVL